MKLPLGGASDLRITLCVLVAACVTHRIVITSCRHCITSSTLVRLLVEVGTITTDKREGAAKIECDTLRSARARKG